MFVITVEFSVKPGFVSEFIEAIERNAAQSRDTEEGCLMFDVCQDPERPAFIFLYEIYTDEAAFIAHTKTPHFLTFDATVKDWTESKEVRRLVRLAG